MNSIAFWKSWDKPAQFIFWLLFSSLLTSIVYFWYAYYANPAPVITWEQFQQLSTEEVLLKTFPKSIFNIPVTGDTYLIFEILSGSELSPNTEAYYLFLVTFSISLLVLVSVISSLPRFWFIVGIGVFSLFIMTFRLESLLVLGMTNRAFPIIVLLLFILVAYYFHAIRAESKFITRFFSFGTLYLLLIGTIIFFGEVEGPLLHVAVNGFALAVILTFLFTLMVAHEIPVAFINVLTKGSRQSKSLQHFLVIASFYLLNLLLTYGIKIGYIDLNIWVINIFALFTFSAVLGIWGFRQRQPLYQSILSADPTGVYFILGLAAMSFATITYFMATANDTILIVLKDLIIYSHLGYGFIFVFYVISNFGSMLTKNLQVHKVLYKPPTMPYFTFRLMGLICTFGFLVFDTNWRTPINQIFASYQNSYGDLYLAQGDAETAEVYYNKSILFRNQNHHAHYALAGIQAARLEPAKVLDEWKSASESYPVEQTIINLADAYRRSGKTSEALYAIEKASKFLPDHAALLNAKGLIYTQLKMPDSALFAFQQARKSNYIKEIAETNLLAASVRFKIAHPADSLLILLGADKEGPKTNALALASLQNVAIKIDFTVASDTVLSATKAAFICNYLINQRETVDTTFIHKAIGFARLPINDSFKEYLLIASAHAFYAQGRVKHAFELTREVAYRTGSGKYFLLLGNWALEQGNPEIAANYFAIAKEKQVPSALFSEALAKTEEHNFGEARILWDSVYNSPDSIFRSSAIKMKSLLNATSAQVISLDDEIKYLFCRYKISLQDSSQFIKVVNSIDDEELKMRALVEYGRRWYELGDNEAASRYLNLLEGLTPSRESTLAEFHYLNCMLIADLQDWDELKRQINSVKLLAEYYPNELVYWNALLNEKEGNQKETEKKFEYLSKANMYFEEGVVSSSQYFAKDTTIDRLKSYSILVEGLLVKPNSVKILKAYVKEAAILGFDDEAEESLDRLKEILPPLLFNRYVKENPDFFDLE